MIRVVDIRSVRVISFFKRQEQCGGRPYTIVIENLTPSKECCEALNKAISQVTVSNNFACHQGVVFRISRHSFHYVKFRFFVGKSDSRKNIGS